MIETKILGDAVGIQRQDVIDKSETTVLPSLANGVITGHFKRGHMDKPFKVTASNYKALLGHDPSNPSYLAVEDAFKNGINELSILRTGGGIGGGESDGGAGNGGGGGVIGCIPQSADIMFNSNYDESPIGNVHARYRVNNGNWIDYSNVVGNISMGLIADFFNTIEVEGEKLIETIGNGGNDTATIAPFRSYRGKSELLGASNSESLSQDVWKIVTPKATTIEFAVTENTINDLVFLAFGQDTTVRSCADVIWEGL